MKSMTGYGVHRQQVGAYSYTVEIKSVNNRYLEIQTRMPHFLSPWDGQIRKSIEAIASRGKVDVWIDVSVQDGAIDAQVDAGLVQAYLKAHELVARMVGDSSNVTAHQIMGYEGVIQIRKTTPPETVWRDLKPCLDAALKKFLAVRVHDGQATRRDLQKLLTVLGRSIQTVRKRAKGLVPDYANELKNRLKAMTGKTIDQNLIMSEAALIASRTDINEELTRLESHKALFLEHLSGDEPCGKTLDFVAQEMNREINTIGSKQNDLALSNEVIRMKSLLEKIREQARNIE
ncbi:MAG TPA: YicC family protein [Spirochaetota bacterium]|nr:YicC family protein [Spirochaetota bacterium]HPH03253.1 YicC family protein [Spirochaetota bacterium]HPN82202.1 YicC family protein [Spirochaetota bacterium]